MKGIILRSARKFVQELLPGAVYDKILSAMVKDTQLRPDPNARESEERIDVQPGVYFVVFWKDIAFGKGPAVSLFVHDFEVLRFDCYGPGKGHYHAATFADSKAKQDRLLLFEDTAPEQIERAIFELTRNLDYYLERNPKRSVRTIVIDRDKLATACEMVRGRLHHFLETVPNLHDLNVPARTVS